MQHPAFSDYRPEDYRDDAHHCARHPSEDEAVHEKSEIDRLKTAKKSRWFSAVTDFAELHVGQNLSPPPIAREEENRQHAADAEAPPDPVPGDSLSRDHAAHKQWRIRRERGRNHRGTGQPPRHIAS